MSFNSSANAATGDSFLEPLTTLGLATVLSLCCLSWDNNEKKNPFTFCSNISTLLSSATASFFWEFSFWSLALLMWWSSWDILSIFSTWHTCPVETVSLQIERLMIESECNFPYGSNIVPACLPGVRKNVLLCLDFKQLSLQLNNGCFQRKCLFSWLIGGLVNLRWKKSIKQHIESIWQF